MLQSMGFKTTSFVTICALALLFALSLAPAFGNGPQAGKTAPQPQLTPYMATAQSACAPPFLAPEGASLQNSEVRACEAAPVVGSAPDWMGKPHRHGYCRCSCGYPCLTSADCGGVSCDPFITCC